MKPSQRQPREVVPSSHLTWASSSFASNSSTHFEPSYNATKISSSDLSAVINASHVSHAIASSYHALTIRTLRQHSKRHTSLYPNSVELSAIRAYHANQVSTSLEDLHVELPHHLCTKATQGYVGTTPMDFYETHSWSQYQQLDNYQPLGEMQPGYSTTEKQDHSVRADFGSQEQAARGLTCWVCDRERYMHAGRSDRDITEWGEDLAGVGAQFDVSSHAEEASPSSNVGGNGYQTTE